jgi:caffeoyl-CoA O-methyltransferase
MPNITYEPIEKYLYDLLPPSEPAVLREMEAQAKQRDIPIVGPAVARLLSLLARISGAKRIFEAGSAIGYSTIWWALAVGDSGRVTYTDGNPKNAEEAKGYFQKAGVAKRIDVRVGDALEILSEEKPASLDIIFNDVDKEDYPRVFKLAVPRLKPGGLFITDNVLWSGRVAGTSADDRTKAIQEFNGLLYGSKDLFPVMIPLRDGVAVARKH